MNAGCTSLMLPPLAPSPRHPLSACVHEAGLQLVAKKQDTCLAFKGDSVWTQPWSSPFFFYFLAKSKMNQHPVPGAHNHGLTFQGNKPPNTWREAGFRAVPVAVNRLWTLWNILGLSFRSLSKLLTSLLSVKRQTALSSELTWHWDMACLSPWLVVSNLFLSILS